QLFRNACEILGAGRPSCPVRPEGANSGLGRRARLGYPARVSRPSRPSDPAPERRFSGRYEVEWAVDCVASDTFLYAAITNISEMGIFVACASPFEVGTQLKLRFQPNPEEEPIILPGRVQWVNRP